MPDWPACYLVFWAAACLLPILLLVVLHSAFQWYFAPFFFSSSFITFFPRASTFCSVWPLQFYILIASSGRIKVNLAYCLPLKRKVWYFYKFPLHLFFLLCVKCDLLTGQEAILSTQNTHNRCSYQRLFSPLLRSRAQQEEKAECGSDSGAFVHLIQCMGYNDPKEMNKGLEAKPRSSSQHSTDAQLGCAPTKLFPIPCKMSQSLEQIHRFKSNNNEACALNSSVCCLPICSAQVLCTENMPWPEEKHGELTGIDCPCTNLLIKMKKPQHYLCTQKQRGLPRAGALKWNSTL